MHLSNDSETQNTYDLCVRRMILWRNIQSCFLITMLLIPSLLFLDVSAQRVASIWSSSLLLFFAAHLRRTHYRHRAESL
jgi:hypothetical protein